MKNGFNIVLADDDADDRFLFENAVKEINANCRVITAHDGEDLTVKLNEIAEQPNIIVLDVNMPKKNGLSCLREIRLTPKYNDVPVVILSTGTSQQEVTFAYDNRANLFIRKPYSYTSLKAIIKYCLNADLAAPPDITKKDFLILDSKQLV